MADDIKLTRGTKIFWVCMLVIWVIYAIIGIRWMLRKDYQIIQTITIDVAGKLQAIGPSGQKSTQFGVHEHRLRKPSILN